MNGQDAFNEIFSNAYAPSGALARQDPPPARQDFIHFDESEMDWSKRPTGGALRMDTATYKRLREFLDSSQHVGTHGAVNPLDVDNDGINRVAPLAAIRVAEAEVIGAGGLSRYGDGPRRLGEM